MVKIKNQMKNNNYHTVETVPKYNREIRGGGKIDTPNTEIQDPQVHGGV